MMNNGHNVSEMSSVIIPQPIKTILTGKVGAPRKEIDVAYLREAMSVKQNITQTELAKHLGIHRNTLHKMMKTHGISKAYTRLTNPQLDTLIQSFKQSRPQSGIRYATGFLRRSNLRVQRHRVIQSLRRVDGIGNFLRHQQKIRRRRYYVKFPNALWHVDGHHKLIRWGIVIHGCVDGFDRTVLVIFHTCF